MKDDKSGVLAPMFGSPAGALEACFALQSSPGSIPSGSGLERLSRARMIRADDFVGHHSNTAQSQYPLPSIETMYHPPTDTEGALHTVAKATDGRLRPQAEQSAQRLRRIIDTTLSVFRF